MKFDKLLILVFNISFATFAFSQEKIIWVEQSNSSVNVANLDKTDHEVILTNYIDNPTTIFFNDATNSIFWGNENSRTLSSLNIDSDEYKNHHGGVLFPSSMGVDNENGWIYYGSGNVSAVGRVRFDGTGNERLFIDNLGLSTYGLDLLVNEDKMYFATKNNIHSAKLDGSSERKVVQNVELRSMVYDRVRAKIYWTEPVWNGPGVIKRCNSNGTNTEILGMSSEEPQYLEVDQADDILYWSDPEEKMIYSCPIDGSSVDTLVDFSQFFSIDDIAIELDRDADILYYATNRENIIYSLDLDSGITEVVASDAIDNPKRVFYDNKEEKLYISDGTRGIIKSNLDGSDVKTIVPGQTLSNMVLYKDSIIYWAWADDELVRVDRNGENPVVLNDEVDAVRDLAIDTVKGVIFWLDPFEDELWSVNVDGSEKERVTFFGLDDSESIAVSSLTERIYWADSPSAAADNIIQQMNYDGADRSTVTDTDGERNLSLITSDEARDRLYWSQSSNGEKGIYRANTDGSDKELLFTSPFTVLGIALAYTADNDGDGYLSDVDCDDENSAINPGAVDIPNNGIDEDCNGVDLISSTHELENGTINIYPNPAIHKINLDVEGHLNFKASIYNLNGKIITQSTNKNEISIDQIPAGTYMLEIKDMDTSQKIVERIVIMR